MKYLKIDFNQANVHNNTEKFSIKSTSNNFKMSFRLFLFVNNVFKLQREEII